MTTHPQNLINLDPMDPRLLALDRALMLSASMHETPSPERVVSTADAFLGWLSPTSPSDDGVIDAEVLDDDRPDTLFVLAAGLLAESCDAPSGYHDDGDPMLCERVEGHEPPHYNRECGTWTGERALTDDEETIVRLEAERSELLHKLDVTSKHRDELARQLRELREQVDHDDPAVPDGCWLIAGERARQIFVKGWTADHDDEHNEGEMIGAAMAYAAAGWGWSHEDSIRKFWPWADETFQPSMDQVANLVKAGALIAAEIDRRTRAEMTVIGPNIADPTNPHRAAAALAGLDTICARLNVDRRPALGGRIDGTGTWVVDELEPYDVTKPNPDAYRVALRDPNGRSWCSWVNLPELEGLRDQLRRGAWLTDAVLEALHGSTLSLDVSDLLSHVSGPVIDSIEARDLADDAEPF